MIYGEEASFSQICRQTSQFILRNVFGENLVTSDLFSKWMYSPPKHSAVSFQLPIGTAPGDEVSLERH